MKATTSTSIDLHFNIHDYKGRLTPSKRGKFHCPVCNDPNFSIDKKGPGYACYKGGCEAKDIQEAIRPAAEVKQLLEVERERKRKTPVPYSLSAKHLKEMGLSGIPEDLARMNIRSADDSHQIAEFLDWKGYMGSIGWLYTGVDPETGFDTGIGQFKPDEKFAFPNGNLAKYLSQKHAYDAACFRVPMWVWRKVSDRYSVPMPDGTAVINDSDEVTAAFWRWVLDNPQLPISPAEGGKKALLLLAKGRIGIPISGVDMATIGRGVDLVPSLKKLAVKGRPVEPFYDADIIEKPDVENALMAFGAALTRAGCVITVPTWDLKLGKGVDDLAVNEGEAWESCLTVLSYKDWLKKLEQQRQESKKRSPVKKSKDTVDSLKRSFDKDSAESSSPAKSNNKRLLNLIGAQWGERLRLNEMTQQVEMDGSEINIDPIYFQIAEELDVDVPKQKASDLVVMLAKKNTYSPVRDYLNSLTDIAPINLECLALRYFGTDNPLHATLLKRTLIAAVARVFKPGCKVDTLCILQGDQGFLKSTFWQKLAGENWFTDNLNEGNEKDEKLKLRRYWLLEFSEFETAYKRKEVAQLKAFLSSSTDSLRVPYGKAIEDFARTSVFVGSTNGEEFLHDPTGERRYWVIPVTQRIPVRLLERERDAIWAAAVAAYKAGEQWWLTPEEDALLAQANQGWQSNDVWEADILDYLQHREVCTISELLTKAITVELQHQDKRGQMRVSVILRRNGWTKAPTQRRIDGKQQWYWERKVVTGGDGVVTEVVTPLNPLPVSIPEVVSPPVTTFLPNFPQNCNSANEPDEPDEPDEPEKKKSFENRGGDTPAENLETPPGQGLEGVTTSPSPPQIIHNPIASPEPETPPTAAPESIVLLIKKVQAAETWAEVESVWNGDEGLKRQIKGYLSVAELKRVGRLYKKAQSQPQPVEPIALPDNSQEPELVEPTPEPIPETETPAIEPIALAYNPESEI
ncbi:VapE domain-containing protein, partial [Microcoleus sp. POL10_C6]|uniref:VapE domain-containing protein n=1 Tax=Microcoleus sp. POL10_C6 TaxID=2818852 RepID=UPI002FD6103A